MTKDGDLHGKISGASKKVAREKLEELFRAHFQGLKNYAKSYLIRDDLAEDIVAEVFVTICRKEHLLESVIDFDKYLYVATRNQALAHLRKAKRMPVMLVAEETLHQLKTSSNPHELLVLDELKARIQAVVDSLPGACQKAYVLVRNRGLSYQQAAEELQVSVLTIQTQMARASKKIRQAIVIYLER